MLRFFTPVRYKQLFAATGLLFLGVVACKPDKDVEEPLLATTPVTLTVPRGFPRIPDTPNNPLTEEGIALGRALFYEKQLSADNTISCGTCHQQAKAFTDGRTHAIGVNGQRNRRSTMAIINVVWDRDLNWDGAASTLEQQARLPIENPVEMHQALADGVRKLQQNAKYPPLFRRAFGSATITEENILKALSQFERTLISANSRFDRFRNGEPRALTADEQQGLDLMRHGTSIIRGAECLHCHITPVFVGPYGQFSNNGLDRTTTDPGRGGVTGLAQDMGRFKAPTLRNIALTAPYMHDGRFQTLEQVLDHYSDHVQRHPNLDPNLQNHLDNTPGGQMNLNADEKRKIIAFLHTLTDSSFISNPAFSDPNP